MICKQNVHALVTPLDSPLVKIMPFRLKVTILSSNINIKNERNGLHFGDDIQRSVVNKNHRI